VKEPSQSEDLLDLAVDPVTGWTFGQNSEGAPYAVPVEGAPVAAMLRGSRLGLRQQLAHRYTVEHGKAPSSGSLADVLMSLEGRALQQPRTQLDLRVAADPERGRALLDLGDDTGRVVVITDSGWRIAGHALPRMFHRTALTGALPEPTPGGDIGRLRELLNVTDAAWPLLLAWLVLCLDADVAHPVVALLGEQGTGKTTAGRCLSRLVDPSPVPLRSAPRSEGDWPVAASGSWVVGLDNVSTIPRWLSDQLCRAATGDGYVRRQLYSDGDLAVLAFRRCVILTAIDPGGLAADLTDRLLAIDLAPIGDRNRRTDQELDAAWTAAHPDVLGGLLDLAVQVRRVLPTVVLDGLPRMADFARTMAAVDLVLGTDGLATYLGQRKTLASEIVDSDPIAAAVRDLAHGSAESGWSGTANELLLTLASKGNAQHRDWPQSPRALTASLQRVTPGLRQLGVIVESGRRGSGGIRLHRVYLADRQSGMEPADNRPDRHHRHPTLLTSDDAESGSDGQVTVVTVDPHEAAETVTTPKGSELRKHPVSDGRDGSDGRDPSSPSHGSTTWEKAS
jgi:hypothetical protein